MKLSLLLYHKKSYWICLLITILTTYGFKLVNYSVHFEDLMHDLYFRQGVKIKAGRWASTIFAEVIYIPFWHTFLALIVMVIAMALFSGLLKKYSLNSFDDKALILFSCIAVSYPAISTYFALIQSSFDIAIHFLLTGIGIFFIGEYVFEKKQIWNGLVGTIFIGTAISIYEYAIIIYFVFMFLLCLLRECYEIKKKTELKILLIMVGKILIFAIIALSIWKLVGMGFQRLHGYSIVSYSEDMLGYDTSSLPLMVKAIIGFTIRFPRGYLRELLHSKDNIGAFIDYTNIFSTVLLFALGIYLSVKKKKLIIFVYSIMTIVSAYGLYLISAETSLINRQVVTSSIFFAFAVSLLYTVIHKKIRIIILIVAVWIVFIQTKYMNQVFEMDYLRYQRDISIMQSVIHDLRGAEREKPLVVAGEISNIIYDDGVISHFSTFYWAPFVIQLFFEKHGYQVDVISIDGDIVNEKARDMNCWPTDGYIMEFDEYIIIKLGEGPRRFN